MPLDELHRDASALIESARAHFATWANDRGYPLQTAAERTAVCAELRGWRASAEHVHENASWRYLGEWRLDDQWARAALAWGGAAAARWTDTLPFPERAYSSFAATLVGWKPLQFAYQQDPPRWLVEHALVPAAIYYIQTVDSAATSADYILAKIVNELIDRLCSGRQRIRITVGVAGLATENAVSSGALTVRPLSPHERGDLLRQSTPRLHRLLLVPLGVPSLHGDLPTHLLYVDEAHDNSVEHPEAGSHETALRALTSFALHGYFVAGLGASAMQFMPDWSISGVSSGPLPMAAWASEVRYLDVRALAGVDATLAALREYSLAEPRTTTDLALHRFALGCSRSEPVDAVLDHVIALEALLLPYDKQTRHADLSYRFRVHGAHWIARPGERDAVWRQLGDVYATRSALAHGGKFPSRQAVRDQATAARSLAAAGLLRAVHDGFPDAVRFRRAVLGD